MCVRVALIVRRPLLHVTRPDTLIPDTTLFRSEKALSDEATREKELKDSISIISPENEEGNKSISKY